MNKSNKPNFKLCEKLATKLLAMQNIDSSKIDIMNLNYDKTIIFDTIQNYAKLTFTPIEKFINPNTQLLSEGCCVPIKENGNEIYLILYNDKSQSDEHLNWTLAHEIGHIYMGHKYDSEIQEIEAHFFAAQLLMPEYVIYKMSTLGTVNVDDIYTMFNVSLQAAQKRLNTYRKKHYINKTYNDEKIWQMMERDIRNHYLYANSSDEFRRFLNIPIIDI
ncbi:ImmA/IrrE family metallo-endopeptidase [Cellulosilyticum lentocellum]|uniref:IrrE N-terminal-like domain-containing protein n=1 Tax=Cellulosilyticum lentocellum (strain ATCC 49066 / DSM 5427 / NCIMB 11756 / RHM5) TaxID=642492 RepID=F2JPG6_CELLD|nr:ImmA/IrrE family metallo-endopeptidase [Cellulosilyticum lentocellum]ADZ82514.1 protein of unknown function DUF955 [Cellulosilyticum lentocellum DSM 5427]